MSVPGHPLRTFLLAGLAATSLVLSACGADSAPADRASQSAARTGTTQKTTQRTASDATQGTPRATTQRAATPYVRIVAAGDIACPPGMRVTTTQCRQASTASWAARLSPRFVFPLGDTQYDRSTLAEYQGSYAKNWGHLLSRTRPTVGNHEYATPGADGYYTYFKDRQPGPPGYYRAATVGWTFYYLNSNCDRIDCAAEARWLDAQMTANPAKCTIVTMHHPRYSSGLEHGNNTAVKPLWDVAYEHATDFVLSGHDHDYERFRPMDPDGHVTSRGIQEMVVGTGGRNLYHLGTRKTGSAYFQARTAGILAMDLRPGTAHWVYRAVNGSILDRGDRACI